MALLQNQRYNESFENIAYKGYEHCIVKEEVMISDVSDDDSNNNNSHKGSLLIDMWDPSGFEDEHITSTEKQNNTGKLSKPKSSDETTNLVNYNERIEFYVERAIKENAKTYCSKCDKKRAVIFRQAKCRTCKSPLIYHCEKCKTCYKSYRNLVYHISTKDIKMNYSTKGIVIHKLYECRKCEKPFILHALRNKHEKICRAEPKFICDHCDYRSRFKSNLIGHIKYKHIQQTKEKENKNNIECSKCGKRYTMKKSLTRHLKVYCGKKKSLQCDHCKYCSYRKDEMVRHLTQNHPTLFPNLAFPCKKCGENFRTYSRLHVHIKNCAK